MSASIEAKTPSVFSAIQLIPGDSIEAHKFISMASNYPMNKYEYPVWFTFLQPLFRFVVLFGLMVSIFTVFLIIWRTDENIDQFIKINKVNTYFYPIYFCEKKYLESAKFLRNIWTLSGLSFDHLSHSHLILKGKKYWNNGIVSGLPSLFIIFEIEISSSRWWSINIIRHE